MRPRLRVERWGRRVQQGVALLKARGSFKSRFELAWDVQGFFRDGGSLALLRKLSRACKSVATLIWSLWQRGRWRSRIADLEQQDRAAIARRSRSKDWWVPDTQPASVGDIAHKVAQSPVVGLNAGEALLGALGIKRPAQPNVGALRAVAG